MDSNIQIEEKIITTARQMFIDKGFNGTSMSDIAKEVGINRTVLHYYFRTKDKMFQAVIGGIIESIISRIKFYDKETKEPIPYLVNNFIEAYFNLFKKHPKLPMFILREIDRDADYLFTTLLSLKGESFIAELKCNYEEAINKGYIKNIPLIYVFYTAYGLMLIPFLTKSAAIKVIVKDGKEFEELLNGWRPIIENQLILLLSAPKEAHK